ncbi:hypothetical protein BCV69DRAFT_88285 [Microstroma glucosiphilum]|uniref:Uncharacterized protein n=1 Tax=Pseudomicrostroma glucosiphilum TaxID=1684307 RepID=A0A316TXN8_9BASI|nr:hypothetical protein BCV69DRAFT_88285 [Pseudomicrostroma glucosiphilum]PWN17910.1 hypothetical protein BCV69DRAFT_88285 [Pseudomicrostroma glucosiphilum]
MLGAPCRAPGKCPYASPDEPCAWHRQQRTDDQRMLAARKATNHGTNHGPPVPDTPPTASSAFLSLSSECIAAPSPSVMSSQKSNQSEDEPSHSTTHPPRATTSTQTCHTASRSHRLTCITTHHHVASSDSLRIALTSSIVGTERGRRSSVIRTVPAEVLAASEVMRLVQDFFNKNRAALRLDTIELTTSSQRIISVSEKRSGRGRCAGN